jgi:hypothetical protein
VSETLDWANTLVLLGSEEVTIDVVTDYLHVLLKNQSDIDLAAKELGSVRG